jgi:hypothetical protein
MTPDDTPHRARRRVRACSAALSSRFHVHIDKRLFAHNGKDETTVHAGVLATAGQTGACRPVAEGTGPGSADRAVDQELGRARKASGGPHGVPFLTAAAHNGRISMRAGTEEWRRPRSHKNGQRGVRKLGFRFTLAIAGYNLIDLPNLVEAPA